MKLFIAALAILFCNILLSQTGDIFPLIKGTALDNSAVKIPFNNEKYSVIAIAYSRDAENDLKEWLNPVFNTFIKTSQETGAFDMADIYDVNFVFIPLISGFKKAAADFKKGTDKSYWPYILETDGSDIKKLQSELKVTDTKVPYFYVLDKGGKIVEVQSGKFSDSKLGKLEDAVE